MAHSPLTLRMRQIRGVPMTKRSESRVTMTSAFPPKAISTSMSSASPSANMCSTPPPSRSWISFSVYSSYAIPANSGM